MGAGGFFFPWLSRAPPAFPIFPVPALRRRLHSLPRLDFLSTTRRGDGRGSAPQPSPSRSQLPRLPDRDRLAQRRRTDAAGRPRATKATSAAASSRSIRAGLVGGHRDRAGQGPRGPRVVMGSSWSSEEERQPLLGPGLGPAPGAAWRSREAAEALPAAAPSPGRVYGRRWLVLLLFSLLGFAQGLVWNTWGPIQNSARQAYGFSSWDIALLVLWGPIGFLPCFAFMWLLDKRGEGVLGVPASAVTPGGAASLGFFVGVV